MLCLSSVWFVRAVIREPGPPGPIKTYFTGSSMLGCARGVGCLELRHRTEGPSVPIVLREASAPPCPMKYLEIGFNQPDVRTLAMPPDTRGRRYPALSTPD